MTAVVLFTDAQVFDGTGRPPFSGEVLVKGNRIEAVAPANAPLDRQRAEVIDCGGATLMPGLVEAHAHLSWPSSVGRIIDAMGFLEKPERIRGREIAVDARVQVRRPFFDREVVCHGQSPIFILLTPSLPQAEGKTVLVPGVVGRFQGP